MSICINFRVLFLLSCEKFLSLFSSVLQNKEKRMASPPRQAPVIPLDLLLGEGAEDQADQAPNSASNASSSPQSPASLSLALESPEGIDCHGNERQALVEQAKFYNNPLLSDVTLVVGNEQYFAHKLILVKSSDVFERMFSTEWDAGDEKRKVWTFLLHVFYVPITDI